VEINFGTVEPQTDYRFEGGRIVCYSRRVERDLDGNVTKETDWEPLSSIGYDRPMTEKEANVYLQSIRDNAKRWIHGYWKG
jgi:hypothetical protein